MTWEKFLLLQVPHILLRDICAQYGAQPFRVIVPSPSVRFAEHTMFPGGAGWLVDGQLAAFQEDNTSKLKVSLEVTWVVRHGTHQKRLGLTCLASGKLSRQSPKGEPRTLLLTRSQGWGGFCRVENHGQSSCTGCI